MDLSPWGRNVDIQEQLTALRAKVARIDRKYADGRPDSARLVPRSLPPERPASYFVEDLMSGAVVETAAGAHFETEKLYERHKQYGSVEISSLIDLPADLLEALSDGEIVDSHPTRWAFLDTETTGLAGGAGTYAFLIGVGSIDEDGFRVRQFFMRDFADEPSQMKALSDYLSRFDVLITYNGKSYDQPLLETRFRMNRSRPPFARMEHLDVLYGARRLWKLRLDSCRLVDLENRILGVEREGDVPGDLIPYFYFEYLRTRQAFRLIPVFHHNVLDIVALACLTAIVPLAFRRPEEANLRHGADYVGIARWLAHSDRADQAAILYRRAVDLGLPDSLLFRTMWDLALLEKKRERWDASLAVLTELASGRNPYRVPALEALAKHYEHRERNYAMALEMTRSALEDCDTPAIRHREERLKRRLEKVARTHRLAFH